MSRHLLFAAAFAAWLPAQSAPPSRLPWRVGERLEYDLRLKLGAVRLGRVGTGYMSVVGIDTVRGRPAYHLTFGVRGGIVGFHVDDAYDSWVDTETLVSLRHTQRIREGGYRRVTSYEIFPERASYAENGGAERPGVASPLDDGSFLYFVRVAPLAVGERQVIDRYFKPAQNPVVLLGARDDSITVPAGRFATLVVQPTIRSGGLFAEGGRAEVWVSQDDARVMVKLQAHVAFGSLELSLRSIHTSASELAAR